MKRLALPLLTLSLAFAAYDLGHADTPAKIPAHAPKISINIEAKTILERAAKMYGSAKKWSGQISLSTEDSKKVSIAFERPKKLRIEQKGEGEYRLLVNDGKTGSDYSNGSGGESSGSSSMPMSTSETLITSSSTSAPGTGIVPVLALLLNGKTGLSEREFQEKTRDATSVTVKQLPDALWKGAKCQRIATDIRYKPAYDLDLTQYREEWWFAPGGKLVKVTGFKLIKADNGVPADKWNDEITSQNFAPKFGKATFIFNPPKK